MKNTLLLAEIADAVTSFRVGHRHHVEEERLHVVVERLGVEETLGQQAQVLAVRLLLLTVHFPDGHLLLPRVRCERCPDQATSNFNGFDT